MGGVLNSDDDGLHETSHSRFDFSFRIAFGDMGWYTDEQELHDCDGLASRILSMYNSNINGMSSIIQFDEHLTERSNCTLLFTLSLP